MKQLKQNKTGLIHLYLLAGLILIFFGILFISTAFKDVSSEYSFQEIVKTSEINNIEIGKVVITNNGPITAKIQLKKFKVCNFDENSDLTLRYIGKNLESYDYNGGKSIELGKKQSEIIKLEVQYYSEKFERFNQQVDLNEDLISLNKTLDLYIFELNEDDYGYSYCKSADKINAIANLEVNIDLNNK